MAVEGAPAEPAWPVRVGLFLVAPTRGLGAIASRRTGGVRDALYLVLLNNDATADAAANEHTRSQRGSKTAASRA